LGVVIGDKAVFERLGFTDLGDEELLEKLNANAFFMNCSALSQSEDTGPGALGTRRTAFVDDGAVVFASFSPAL